MTNVEIIINEFISEIADRWDTGHDEPIEPIKLYDFPAVPGTVNAQMVIDELRLKIISDLD